MLLLAGAEGARTVRDAERRRRNSRARTMTSSVDGAMDSTSLRSRTSPTLSTAMARANVADKVSSVDRSWSPQSQTTTGPGSGAPHHAEAGQIR